MSVEVDSDIMIYTEELEDTPPDIFDGLTFTITGENRDCILVRPFRYDEGYFMIMNRDEVETLKNALVNFLGTGCFDLEE